LQTAESRELQTLKELGLTEYEAKVYLTALTCGSIPLRELAFKSGVPRTKVYSTVRSLANKGLLRLTEHPMKCVAVDADQVFEPTVRREEKRLRELKVNLARLKKLKQQGMKGLSLVEGHYYIFVPHEAVAKLSELLVDAQYSFHAVVDSHGVDMLKECGKQLTAISANEVDCKLVISDRDADSVQELFRIPFEVRAARVADGRSLFIFDRSTVLISNSSTGNTMMISTSDIAMLIDQSVFQPIWEGGIELERFTRLVNLGLSEEIGVLKGDQSIFPHLTGVLIRVLQEDKLRSLCVELFNQLAAVVPSRVFTMTPEAALPMWAELIDLSLAGRGKVRYDNVAKLITLESSSKNYLPESIWLLAFVGYLEVNRMPLRIINRIESDSGTIVQGKVTWNLLA
jgi:sugar-specific transcriptional regulator TrmB